MIELFATAVVEPVDVAIILFCTDEAPELAISLTVVSELELDRLELESPFPASARQISIAVLSVTLLIKKPTEHFPILILISHLNFVAENSFLYRHKRKRNRNTIVPIFGKIER